MVSHAATPPEPLVPERLCVKRGRLGWLRLVVGVWGVLHAVTPFPPPRSALGPRSGVMGRGVGLGCVCDLVQKQACPASPRAWSCGGWCSASGASPAPDPLPFPRPAQDGEHYHFTSRERMEAGIARGDFLEHAHVHSNIYGTSAQAVRDVAAAGLCCVLDIDVQGARQVRAAGLRAVFVFIAPPNLEQLEKRLRGRGTDAEEAIKTRLANAREELER